MFPADADDPTLQQCIHPLCHEDFIRMVLAIEITHELIQRQDCVSRAEAMGRLADSCIWGEIHLPEITGVAGEDIDVEYQHMLHLTKMLRTPAKQKEVDPREYGKGARVQEIDDEIDDEASLEATNWLTCVDEDGRQVFIVD